MNLIMPVFPLHSSSRKFTLFQRRQKLKQRDTDRKRKFQNSQVSFQVALKLLPTPAQSTAVKVGKLWKSQTRGENLIGQSWRLAMIGQAAANELPESIKAEEQQLRTGVYFLLTGRPLTMCVSKYSVTTMQ